MTMHIDRAKLWAQLGFVADRDAAALRHEYEWPPVGASAEEWSEAARLDEVARRCFGRAGALGFIGGTDAAFGEDTEGHP